MAATAPESRHWRKRIDADGICWLLFDKQDSSTNVFSRDALEELRSELNRLADAVPAGVVIGSAKASGFVAGADITEFQDLTSSEQVVAASSAGQAMCQQVADLPCPTVAAIDGFALGGGLELALACDYRVATESYERSIGLPEVQLGFNPGWGGTIRSVQLLGAPLALDLMLSGRSVSSVEALKMGLFDRVVAAEALDEAAAAILKSRPALRRPPLYLRLLNLAPLRPWLARSIRARVRRRANPAHYPAPFAIIDLWQQFGASGSRAYEAEARSIGELLVSRTSKNLVRVYFLRERLKDISHRSRIAFRSRACNRRWCDGWRYRELVCAARPRRHASGSRNALCRTGAGASPIKLSFGKLLRGPGQAAAAEKSGCKVDLDANEDR